MENSTTIRRPELRGEGGIQGLLDRMNQVLMNPKHLEQWMNGLDPRTKAMYLGFYFHHSKRDPDPLQQEISQLASMPRPQLRMAAEYKLADQARESFERGEVHA